MRTLVILVALSYCSAQLVLPSAPWVLPYANLITNPDAETEVKPLALNSPYFHPYAHNLASPYFHPLGQHLATPYNFPFGHHLPYVVAGADGTYKQTEFPYIYQTVKAEEPAVEAEEPAVETASRRRRDVVSVPLPYFHAVPTVKKATIETKQFEATDAATPADTTKLELTTKEHEISVPAIKYVQPHINLKPVTYTALSPAFSPYHAGVAPGVFPYHAGVAPGVLPYHAGVAPGVLPYHAGFPAYSALHPYHYPTLATAPVIKIDEE